jgi:excisionase family DNA binding protein
MIASSKLLTIGQVAELLNVCRKTVVNLIVAGKIPYVSVGEGTLRQSRRIHPDDLSCFIEKRRHCQPTPNVISTAKRRKRSNDTSISVIDFRTVPVKRRTGRHPR